MQDFEMMWLDVDLAMLEGMREFVREGGSDRRSVPLAWEESLRARGPQNA